MTGADGASDNSQSNLLRHRLLAPINRIQATLYMAGKDLETGRDQSLKDRLREIESLLSDLAQRIEQHLDAISQKRGD